MKPFPLLIPWGNFSLGSVLGQPSAIGPIIALAGIEPKPFRIKSEALPIELPCPLNYCTPHHNLTLLGNSYL